MNKSLLINLLRAFVARRPNLEFGNYGCHKAYRAELRHVGQQLKDARALLQAVEASSAITGDMISLLLKSGRLTLSTLASGGYKLDFCACQYEPTEYRPAVSRLCANLLWAQNVVAYPHFDGTERRQFFRRWFGLGVAKRWFN